MFRHTGLKRSYKQNLRLAVLLCLTAGMVNAASLLSFSVLTTNVTGHAALLAQTLASGEMRAARMVALWLFLFLAGAFFSGLCIHRIGRNKTYVYTVPIIVEIILLVAVASLGDIFDGSIIKTEYFAGSLLFAMGLQNALVSAISGSVVRTTHLTGMFTDLGIDLSLMISSSEKDRTSIKKRIALRVVIISFFLAGGILGGFVFLALGYYTFFIPAGILMFAMFYDAFRIRFRRTVHKIINRKAVKTA